VRIRIRQLTAAATIAAAMALPAGAAAQSYPPASDPGKGPPPPARGGTLKVCKKGCRYKRIQAAIDAAGKGTTIRVGKGIYREGLRIRGRGKHHLRLIGDARRPSNVVLEGRGLRGARAQNGVLIDGADGVTVDGFHARHFKGNGFFAVDVDGYELTHLVAEQTGTYGIYAFNSKGGEMSSSEAFYNSDSGFYVGQTPPQTRPKRTILSNLTAWGNVLGYSGTNSRYVTITRSRFFNNGVGIVPNVLESERFMPHEDNAIVDNDVFWNNWDYYAGAPFAVRRSATGTLYPIGTGILLFGGRTATVEGNRVFGNYLTGFGMVSQFLLKPQNAALGLLEGNRVRSNDFGLAGQDLNGRDMLYDGSGSSNCFAGNVLRSPNVPADDSTFVACGSDGANVFQQGVRQQAIDWVTDATHEANWIKHPHRQIAGIQPLERWDASYPRPR
jgi:hypothetical protein